MRLHPSANLQPQRLAATLVRANTPLGSQSKNAAR
jgi:hypothetical protein